jgi:hypothetical protein
MTNNEVTISLEKIENDWVFFRMAHEFNVLVERSSWEEKKARDHSYGRQKHGQ